MTAKKNIFDENNRRVLYARKKKTLNNRATLVLLITLCVALVAGGASLLFLGNACGWLIIGMIGLPLMLVCFIRGALKSVPIKKGSEDFTDLIAEELLTKLKPDLTAKELVEILSNTHGGVFMMVRFGLTLPIFRQIEEYLPADTAAIYARAREIYHKTEANEISGAIILTALVENITDYAAILSKLKLSIADLYAGVMWFDYLDELSRRKEERRDGGIARDFAFGFALTLQHYAVNISSYATGKKHVEQSENEKIIEQIIYTLSHRGRKNVTLVGAYGSGRSTIVHSLAETLMDGKAKVPENLRFRQIYSLDVQSLIASARNDSELQYIMTKILNEVYQAKNVILCLDNAHLFFENGSGSVDISNILTPVLEAGNVCLILIMDDQKFLEISAKNAALGNVLNKIVVHPSPRGETIRILMDVVPYLEYDHNVVYTYAALTEAYQLSEQYIHEAVMPGKAKMLLESAAKFAEKGLVTAGSVQEAVENAYGVKVGATRKVDEKEKLLNLESLIHEQMVDQQEAVAAVANALRRAGAGMKNQKRPIGTFLFLGPTGVGKTELAKTLSRVYFNGEDNLIRLDLNEFATSEDAKRLTRDGLEDPLSLTAQVMKRPFSVILLDEIEKAHPAALATLLQMLDEGILRDEKNREISFRDTIVIATSNAGANEIREKISAGAKIEEFKEELIEKLINSNEFRPEFLNRFDEICLFKPLTKEDLAQILDLILADINKRLTAQKISVTVMPEAREILIEKGYDPKMGARPMRRTVEKTVENIVAAAILSGAAQPGSNLTITPSEITIA